MSQTPHSESEDLAKLVRLWPVSREPAKKVYFLMAPSLGLVKIGCSDDPLGRVATLRTLNAAPLELLTVLRNVQESELHTRFKLDRQHGEWFRVTPGMVSFLIRQDEPEAADRLAQVLTDAP